MSNESDATDKAVTKLLVDKPLDFRFHAAYSVYSDAWDRNSSAEVRTKLNEIMTSLSTSEIDYPGFYQQVNQYRADLAPGYGGSARIQTQRKRDFRRGEERKARNSRHRR
jgi:hypothetical protein